MSTPWKILLDGRLQCKPRSGMAEDAVARRTVRRRGRLSVFPPAARVFFQLYPCPSILGIALNWPPGPPAPPADGNDPKFSTHRDMRVASAVRRPVATKRRAG